MLRESYFQDHPKQKMVFECALLRPPAHLTGQIHQLHMPLQKLNHQFLAQQLERMPLRPGLCREKAMRYLESVEYYFSSALGMYCNHQNAADLHGMLEGAGELLDMILFGVAR